MKSTPSYLLKNCALWANEDVKVGQMSDVTINLPKEKTEGLLNAGMIRERQVGMGVLEHEPLEFTLSAFDPATLKLLTASPGTEVPFMVTGALKDEDGTTHSAVYYMRGRVVSNDPGTWKVGEKAELKCTVVQNYAKLEIDNQPIFEIDDFDYSVGGESQTGGIRDALLLS